jgi:hypothetical protein
MNVAAALKASLPNELVDALLTAYEEIERNFIHGKWKASELDAGHFVEAARRVVEHRLFGAYTPIGKDLPKFNDQALQRYETASGDESYRMLIPRVLRAIFGIRNKRGVGHLGAISPNEMDATLILYSVKWVLAEILRIESGLAPSDTQKAIDRIVERQTALIWKEGAIVRVLDRSLKTRDEVLLLLYDRSPQNEEELRTTCEYKNVSDFRKILRRLHTDKLVFYGPDRVCLIMPPGVKTAERIVRSRI